MKAFHAISSMTTSLLEKPYALWDTKKEIDGLGSNTKLIQLNDALHGVLRHVKTSREKGGENSSNLSLPDIVVVGTQSSGKSSLLNSLIGMDILPTGKQMVTRTPLRLQLIQSKKQEQYLVKESESPCPNKSSSNLNQGQAGQAGQSEQSESSVSKTKERFTKSIAYFGYYDNGLWETTHEVPVDYPTPTHDQQQEISGIIEQITVKKAGSQKNVSQDPIHLRIVSPHVVNLTFTDLPGLTAVACTDKGQPKDIKEKIEQLVAHYMKQPQTIILAVMAARPDLEADMGLEVVKRYDPNFERTIGVLTKLDLLHDDRDMGYYLTNQVSKDLQLKHGYFAVKNRNHSEQKTLSVQEGLQKETDYFSAHDTFSAEPYLSQTGIVRLKSYVSNLLASTIRQYLPSLQAQVVKQIEEVEASIAELGENVPQEAGHQSSYVHNMLSNFSRQFNDIVYSRGSHLPTGRKLKEAFVLSRDNLSQVNPFREGAEFKQDYLDQLLLNSEGNHMSFPYPPVEILEKCLQDRDTRPLYALLKPMIDCCETITNELVELVQELTRQMPFQRFKPLQQWIRAEVIQRLIIPHSSISQQELHKLIDIQVSYIWTEDPQFREDFKTAFEKFGSIHSREELVANLRVLLESYVNSTNKTLQDMSPKTIMYFLVKQTCEKLYSHLFEAVATQDISTLLVEEHNIDVQRKDLSKKLTELQQAQSILSSQLDE